MIKKYGKVIISGGDDGSPAAHIEINEFAWTSGRSIDNDIPESYKLAKAALRWAIKSLRSELTKLNRQPE